MVKNNSPRAAASKASPKIKQIVTISLTKKKDVRKYSVKGLSIRIDGFRCKVKSCAFVATDNRLIMDHTKEKHAKVRRNKSKAKKAQSILPPNSCVHCKAMFQNSRQLKFHIKGTHSGKVKKAFSFRVPGYMKVACPTKMIKSEETSSPAFSIDYKCSICDDKFATPMMLSGHVKNVHELVRPKPLSRISMISSSKPASRSGQKLSCAKKLF